MYSKYPHQHSRTLPAKKAKKHHLGRVLLPFLLITGLVGYGVYCLHRALPSLEPSTASLTLRASAPAGTIAWPSTGQSAVAIAGTPILQTNGTQKPVPIASVAKVITALCVLQKHPLAANAPGPSLTLGQNDIDIYDQYLTQNGSVVPILLGEKITLNQALQAIMLPSANNIADSLAVWAFGSLTNYQTYANTYLLKHGIKNTHIGTDASGLSASTTSTAADLAKIGLLAMQQPALKSIVALRSAADFPQVGTITNYNVLLGTHNIIGIKTGNSDDAGGAYLSASVVTVNAKPTTIVTAHVGAANLYESFTNSLPIIDSAQSNFSQVVLLAKGAVVAEYRQPWGGAVPAKAVNDVTAQAWNGSIATATASLSPITVSARARQTVGNAVANGSSATSPIVLQRAPSLPSLWWRLTHPF